MPTLVISLPDGSEATHELTKARVTIGRAEDNAIQIDDASLSSHHAEIRRAGESYQLVDNHSTNGTRLNGVPLENPKILKAGDSVRFGSVDAIYEPVAGSAPQSLPELEEVISKPATSSARPSDFGNEAPFQRKKVQADPAAMAAKGLFVVALLAFAAAVAVILMAQPPQF